jgi:hypothetical protein
MRRRGLLVVALAVAALAAVPAPFVVLNIVAGAVYALALPFVAIVTSYVYFDALARHELEQGRTRRAACGVRACTVTATRD